MRHDNRGVKIKLTEFQKGYLAGLIDGEGTICISKRFEKKRQKSFLWAEIVIGNVSLPLLENIKSIIGGFIYKVPPQKSHRPTHKQMYRLTRADMGIIRQILILLEPYLIVKKSQAKLMISFCNSRLNKSNTWTKAYSESDFEMQLEMKVLNKRGLEVAAC